MHLQFLRKFWVTQRRFYGEEHVVFLHIHYLERGKRLLIWEHVCSRGFVYILYNIVLTRGTQEESEEQRVFYSRSRLWHFCDQWVKWHKTCPWQIKDSCISGKHQENHSWPQWCSTLEADTEESWDQRKPGLEVSEFNVSLSYTVRQRTEITWILLQFCNRNNFLFKKSP